MLFWLILTHRYTTDIAFKPISCHCKNRLNSTNIFIWYINSPSSSLTNSSKWFAPRFKNFWIPLCIKASVDFIFQETINYSFNWWFYYPLIFTCGVLGYHFARLMTLSNRFFWISKSQTKISNGIDLTMAFWMCTHSPCLLFKPFFTKVIIHH